MNAQAIDCPAKAPKHRRDHRGRYEHEWGVVAQGHDPYVEIIQCQTQSCGIFENAADGKRYRTLTALRKAHPALNTADSDRDFWDQF